MASRSRKRSRHIIDATGMPPDVRTVIASPPAADAVEKIPYVGPLDTPAQYRKFLNRVIREVRRGVIPSQVGTRLGWLIRQGFEMVYKEEALTEAKLLREQLTALSAQPNSPPLPFEDLNALLPTLESDDVVLGEKS